jgi:hypothetical protein
MKAEIEVSIIESIKQTYSEAQLLAASASEKGREAILKARECGQHLISAKEAVGHGGWLTWLANPNHGWNLTAETARKWMQLAEVPIEQLEQALSLRQAYIAAGILPEPHRWEKQSSSLPGPVKWMSLVRKTIAEFEPYRTKIETIPTNERESMKEQLKPLVELYARL